MARGFLGLGALALGLATSTVFAEPATLPDRWMVATGMGGCAEVSEVSGQIGDVPRWSGPEDFVNSLRNMGLQVSGNIFRPLPNSARADSCAPDRLRQCFRACPAKLVAV